VIAHAVHETGRREIIGLDIGEAETEAFWTELLRSLVARGLLGVQLAISDAHPGLKAALATVLGARVISDGIEVARRRAATAGRGRCPQPRYIASVAFATPDCISCAFITGESVIFAPSPMKSGSAAGGMSLESFISKKISAVRIPSSAMK
jgi:hypothetical protein